MDAKFSYHSYNQAINRSGKEGGVLVMLEFESSIMSNQSYGLKYHTKKRKR